MVTLGEKLKSLREQSGKTQQEIATILCLNRVTYTQYENNKRIPPLDSLKKLAEIYNVTIDELTGREAPAKSPINENKKIPKDLKKILKDEAITLNGRMLSEEDKEKMYKIIEAAFWEAKEMNKRK